MKRLTKTDLVYLHILHIIWELIDYYSTLLKVDAGDDPTKIPATIMSKDGLTYIRFQFSKVLNEERPFSSLQMRDIYNEYLRTILLPSQSFLKPFSNGTGFYDVMEALYIDSIIEDYSSFILDVIYVDNPLAFNYVSNNEKEFDIGGLSYEHTRKILKESI